MLSPTELKTLLRQHGIRLTKRLGQHHLVDRSVIERFVEACRLSGKEAVVEIGPGLGALTEPLARRAGRVIAVEVDRRIGGLLAERLACWPNVSVVRQDILEFPWGRTPRVVVAGAIPYHITSPILVSLSEHRRMISRAVLVVQSEVARRLAASPGTKAYGRLSVLAQFSWEVSVKFRVPRSAFFPPPSVDSQCIELSARARPAVAVEDEAAFFEVVKAAFAHRRKTLANCLAGAAPWRLPRSQAAAAVTGIGLSPSVRGETLSLEQFARLSNGLEKVC
jgi:16S rRNA (adenine1518-N6/adenine1519-N6)-dimethyltransferase